MRVGKLEYPTGQAGIFGRLAARAGLAGWRRLGRASVGSDAGPSLLLLLPLLLPEPHRRVRLGATIT